MKFTSADFISATTTTSTPKRKRPPHIALPSSELRLPVTSPSPLFNEEINTESFPEYDPVENMEPLHCVLHCKEEGGIRKWLVYVDHKIPNCRCTHEKERVVESVPRPPLHIDDRVMETLRGLAANAVPEQEIDIHYTDAQTMMAYLENYVTAQALQNKSLIQTMLREFRGEDVSKVMEVTEAFFTGMRVYFSRTLSESGYRTLTIYQLRLELNVYLWTMLQDWVEEYCDKRTQRRLSIDDAREYAEYANFGAPGAVARLWKECMEDVVGLTMWRHEQAQQFEAGRVVLLVVFGCAISWLLLGVMLKL